MVFKKEDKFLEILWKIFIKFKWFNSTWGESSFKGSGQGNNTKKFDKGGVKYYNCQKLGHFVKECNVKSKENQGDEAKVARQEVDDDNTLLVMIIEENYGMEKLLDNNSSNCQKLGSSVCSAENYAKTHSERNTMVTIRDGTQGSSDWYLNSGCSMHMTGR